jgi:hypothetical protein
MKRFVNIHGVEYSTNFDFFLKNQVCVIKHLDKNISICSCIEKRIFIEQGKHLNNEKNIFNQLLQIHNDIITLKYGGELTC